MEFRQDGDNMGSRGGSDLNGILVGSVLAKDDGNKSLMMAALVIVIVFIIAIIAFAIIVKDNNKVVDRNYGGGTDIAAILATMVAAKGVDNNSSKDSNFDMLEIKAKLEHNEDRATARETQSIISQQGQSFMQLGFGLSNQIKDSEKDTLKEFGEIKQLLGMQGQAIGQINTILNNKAIIDGLVQQLRAC